VARGAGVSLATASRVLNGSTHPVSEKTRERVLAAARELDYARSGLARALVTKQSRIAGLIVGDIVDPYFAQIARGFEDVAGRAGYLTMLCNADRQTTRELSYVSVLREYHAEGVVFAASGAIDDPADDELRALVTQASAGGMNVVSVAPRNLAGSTILVDNRAAGYDVVDYLISLGHRRIALVAGPAVITAGERLDGFGAALRDHDLEPIVVFDGDFSFESGQEAAMRMLAEPQLPDGVACVNDASATGVLMTLRQARITIPKQTSVMGIGDTHVAGYLQLSTVNLASYELGAAAARQVLSGQHDESHVILPHRLVPRSTTARRSIRSRGV
jgi:LacI family transcriptional regulator